MGLGVVLLFWGFLGAGAALAAGAILAAIVANRIRQGVPGRRRAMAAVLLFPLATVVYLGAAFIGYAAWCEKVRGVDPGFGDCWRVPLGYGHALCMVDTPEQAFITASHEDRVRDGLRSVAVHGRHVVGEGAAPGSFFLIDMPAGTRAAFPTRAALAEECCRLGFELPTLLTPEAFYRDHRGQLADLCAVLLAAIVPCGAAGFLLRRLMRLGRRHTFGASSDAHHS